MRPAISLEGVTKCFGSFQAVSDVSFDVQRGEVFAFLGPNGAGKSTTVRMLCTLTLPTAGELSVAGFSAVRDPQEVRRRIGLVFQDRTLDGELTAEENLCFHAVLYSIPRRDVASRIEHVLELVRLSDRRKDIVGTFSGGMARRLEIARAMLHTPEVLFLDEPTVGLDPQTRARIWDDIHRLRDEHGVTVFVTTHYLDEVTNADRIAILDNGKLVALDTPAALQSALGHDTVTLVTTDDFMAAEALRSAGYTVRVGQGSLVVPVDDGEAEVAPIVRAVPVDIHTVRVRRSTLDDVFLHFTGREIRDESVDPTSLRALLGGIR